MALSGQDHARLERRLFHSNSPGNRDVLSTLLMAILTGYQRYAHVTAFRNDRGVIRWRRNLWA